MLRGAPESILVSYATKGKASALIVPANRQLAIYGVRAVNNQGGAQNVGICRKHLSSKWSLIQLTTGGTVYTDKTASVQAATATQIFTATNNDGFIVQSERRSGVIGVTIGTSAGAGATNVVSYWNGSAFATLTTLETHTYTGAADQWLAFRPPSDWVTGGPAAAAINQSWYSMQVQATTAPASQCTITSLWVGEFLEMQSAVANNAQIIFPPVAGLDLYRPVLLLNGGEGLFPYFATAAAANQLGITYGLSE